MQVVRRVMVALALVAAACGHRGTKPYDMGVAEHEAAAQRETVLARQHAAQYDPDADAQPRCDPAAESICWTPDNPTEPHAYEARHRLEIAQRHRAASVALREAEARACSGIPDVDRVTSPFEHARDIRRVTVLTDSRGAGPTASTYRLGIEVEFAAVPGLDVARLQRLVDCHGARNAVIGYATTAQEHPRCPLAVGPVDTVVRTTTDGGYEITVVPRRTADVNAVVLRGRALRPAP